MLPEIKITFSFLHWMGGRGKKSKNLNMKYLIGILLMAFCSCSNEADLGAISDVKNPAKIIGQAGNATVYKLTDNSSTYIIVVGDASGDVAITQVK